MTCTFGMAFLVLGNLAGNALQFGIYVQTAIDPQCQDSCVQRWPVIGQAIYVLTVSALVNVSTRRFSIWLNNIFGVLKVALLIVIAVVGIAYGTIHGDGCKKIVWEHKN